jgi:hypothetical protein
MSNFSDLINIDEINKKEDFTEDRWTVSFYCKDCKKIVETKRPNTNWYLFICNLCNWKNIAIWTYEWLKSNYKIK